MSIKTCKWCGQTFEAPGTTAYCCPEHKKLARKEQMREQNRRRKEKRDQERGGSGKRWTERTCTKCGAKFKAIWKSKTMCDQCRDAEIREKMREQRKQRKAKRVIGGKPRTKLEAFIMEAEARGMNYAEAQIEETIERIKKTGQSRITSGI